jgi:hypothetical protein
MTCVPITPEMAYLLEACRTWPLAPEVLEQLEGTPEWEQAQTWGWTFGTGDSPEWEPDTPVRYPKGSFPTDAVVRVSSFPPCRSPTFQCQFHPRNLASTVSKSSCSSSDSPSPVDSSSSHSGAAEFRIPT